MKRITNINECTNHIPFIRGLFFPRDIEESPLKRDSAIFTVVYNAISCVDL
jgi:hypothetical protein